MNQMNEQRIELQWSEELNRVGYILVILGERQQSAVNVGCWLWVLVYNIDICVNSLRGIPQLLHVAELVMAWERGNPTHNTKRHLCRENEIDNQPTSTQIASQKFKEINVEGTVSVGRWVNNGLN